MRSVNSAVNTSVLNIIFLCSIDSIDQAPVVQKVDNAVHCRNLYTVDNTIGFPNTYLPESDLSDGSRYPTFENKWGQ